MSESDNLSPTLYAIHVPEPDETFNDSAYDVHDPVTGEIEIGVELEGARFPITRLKAGAVADRIALAKSKEDGGSSSGLDTVSGGSFGRSSSSGETGPTTTDDRDARIAELQQQLAEAKQSQSGQ